MSKNAIMIDLDDPRSDKIADAISNKTSKKILAQLAENEMSPSDIAEQLNLPLNTVTYNLKNLTEAGLIEKSKKLFWSSKGKKMERYKVSNKKIVISPKSMIKGVLPTVLITAGIALIIRSFSQAPNMATNTLMRTEEYAASAGAADSALMAEAAPKIAELAVQSTTIPNSWTYFLLGGLTALLILLLWNYRRQS